MNNSGDPIDEIFATALDLPDNGERAAFLERTCGHDLTLRAEVESLLAASAAAGTFLESPAPGSSPPTSAPQPIDPSGAAGPQPERSGDRIGRYKLLEKIGEGGMGSVWMAEQHEPVRRRVALKVIKLGMDTREVVARFEAERQALALMDHPNIARVFDGGATEQGRPYFVMELVRGVRLTDYCDQQRLSTGERLELFTHVCHAVQHAHQKGIIHRDLKPSNVLVTTGDGDGSAARACPKIIDFGIAKATNQALTDKTLFTRFMQFLGTPAYMSPEQAEMTSLDIDTRSDIYSLGVLLYELLTGQTPFDGRALLEAGLDQMRRVIREQEPVRPSTRLGALTPAELTTTAQRRQTESPRLLASVRGDLDWIVMKCLEKDRARRYDTANGLAQDLQRHLSLEPVLARPPSALYRWQTFARKHRWAVLAGAAFIAVLTLATVVSTVMGLWANRERLAAEKSDADARAVIRFFQSRVLAVARPEGQEGGLGRDVSVRAAVEAAEPRISEDFRNQPLVEASVRDVLGRTYHYLGEFESGIRQHRRALELREAHLPPVHRDILDSVNHLALDYTGLGHITNSIPLHQRALALQRQLPPNPDGSDGVTLLGNLASAYLKAGRHREALPLYEQALADARRELAPDHDDRLTAMNNLAQVYRNGGRLKDAVPLLEEVLQTRQKVLPPGHPRTIHSIQALGTAYQNARRPDDAITLLGPALAVASRQLGSNHVTTLGIMDTLGLAYKEAGDFTNSVALLSEEVILAQKRFGPDSLTTLQALNNLAVTYITARQYSNSLPLLEEAYQRYTNLAGAHHPSAVTVGNNLAVIYNFLNRTNEALRMAEQAVVQQSSIHGPTHVDTLTARNNLAALLRRMGRPADALPHHREVVIAARTSKEPGLPLGLWLRNLAICYQDLDQLDEALALFQEVFALVQPLGRTHADYLSAHFDLAKARQLARQFADASPLWRVVLEIQESQIPPSRSTLADTRTLLGVCLLWQARFVEAEPFLRQNLSYFEQERPDQFAHFQAQALLGWSLFGQTNLASAEPLLRQGYEGIQRTVRGRVPRLTAQVPFEIARCLAALFEMRQDAAGAAEWRAKASQAGQRRE